MVCCEALIGLSGTVAEDNHSGIIVAGFVGIDPVTGIQSLMLVLMLDDGSLDVHEVCCVKIAQPAKLIKAKK